MAEAPMLVPHEQWNREGWRPATPPLQSLAMVWSSFGLDIAAREIFAQLTNSFLGAVRLANITAPGTVGIETEQIHGLPINQAGLADVLPRLDSETRPEKDHYPQDLPTGRAAGIHRENENTIANLT